MTTYTQSSYDIFVYKVLLPNLRTILLGLACIAIGCGSFLETNDITKDCSFHNAMSLFEVSIYQNISDRYAITPTSVTFGLWRQCYYYAQNCTCTPISLSYQLDAQQTIFAATNNQTMPNLNPTKSSYIKIVPLIMAISFTLIAFLFSFLTNYTIVQIKYTIVHIGFILAAIVVLAIPYGWSIQTYKTSIMNACQAAEVQPVHCASMAARLEIIILGVAVGLLTLTIFLICCGIHKLDSNDTIQEIYIDEKLNSPSSSSNNNNNNNNNNGHSKRQSIMYNVQRISGFKSSSTSQISDYSTSSKTPYTTTDEALDAWHDVAMLDGQQDILNTMPLRPPPVNPNGRRSHELYQESHMNYPNIYKNNDDDHHYKYNKKSNYANNSKHNNNNNSNNNSKQQQRLSSNTLGNTFHPTPSSSSSLPHINNKNQQYNSNNNSSYELIPPTLPFVDNNNTQRRRRNSSQQSPQLPRPSSHASGNTFGANEMLSSDLPSSTISFHTDDHYHGNGDHSFRTTTPTSMTYRSERAESHGSICFTPTYSHSSGSNPRNSSGISYNRNHSQPHLYQQEWNHTDYKRKNSTGSMMMIVNNNNNNNNNKSSFSSPSSPNSSSSPSAVPSSHHHHHQKYSNVPTLQSPPTSSSSRHPLSNKVINDERIGAYFQQQPKQ